MKLNKEMVEGMGGTQSEQYQEFRKQCYTAFLHLRRYVDLLDIENFGKFISQSKKDICLSVFPGGSVVKNPPANAGDVGSIPGLGRTSGE